MSDSLFKSACRALIVTFCGVSGILLAFFLLVWLLSTVDSSEETISTNYSIEILPNAVGERTKLSKSAPVILQVEIQGIIGALELTKKSVENILIESREGVLANDRVKGVLLLINSPGGTVTDADGIYRAILEYKARYKVPVIAYVDGLCASGGMYTACAADEIYASTVSIVGSIGVLTSAFLNVSKLMEKVGVESLTVSAGKGKDDLDPLRPWKADEAKNIQDITQYYYLKFVDLVVKHRPKVDREALITKYGAQIFPAAESIKVGLIDGVEDSRGIVLNKLLKKLGIEDSYYQVVHLENSSWFNQLFKTDSPIVTGKIKHELQLDSSLPLQLLNQPLFLYRP